jgi:hypothetical protein
MIGNKVDAERLRLNHEHLNGLFEELNRRKSDYDKLRGHRLQTTEDKEILEGCAEGIIHLTDSISSFVRVLVIERKDALDRLRVRN